MMPLLAETAPSTDHDGKNGEAWWARRAVMIKFMEFSQWSSYCWWMLVIPWNKSINKCWWMLVNDGECWLLLGYPIATFHSINPMKSHGRIHLILQFSTIESIKPGPHQYHYNPQKIITVPEMAFNFIIISSQQSKLGPGNGSVPADPRSER